MDTLYDRIMVARKNEADEHKLRAIVDGSTADPISLAPTLRAIRQAEANKQLMLTKQIVESEEFGGKVTEFEAGLALKAAQWNLNRAKRKLRQAAKQIAQLPPRAASLPPVLPARSTRNLVALKKVPVAEHLRRQAREAYHEYVAVHTPPCVTPVQYPRFLSQVRTMGPRRSFNNHQQYCEYQVMAGAQHRQGKSIGFAYSAKDTSAKKAKRATVPGTDERSVRKALLLNTQERFLVRLPKI